jgi:hypothetical protein
VSCFAEKLLANADRARDTSSNSRDLIDLAFMTASWSLHDFNEGRIRAEDAYGSAVSRELLFALDEFDKPKVRTSCIQNLALSNPRKLDRGLKVLRKEIKGLK